MIAWAAGGEKVPDRELARAFLDGEGKSVVVKGHRLLLVAGWDEEAA